MFWELSVFLKFLRFAESWELKIRIKLGGFQPTTWRKFHLLKIEAYFEPNLPWNLLTENG